MGISQSIKRGEVWQVNLDPAAGHEINKSRPAVIIQNDIGNKYSPTTIIAPITSKNTDKVYPFETIINTLRGYQKSKVLLNQIRAIDKSRLVKKVGRLSENEMLKVDSSLRISLCLN